MNFIAQRSNWDLITVSGGIILAFAMVMTGLFGSFLKNAEADTGEADTAYTQQAPAASCQGTVAC